MTFDRSVIAHEQREAFFQKHKNTSQSAECLVWCMTEDKVHGACIMLCYLGPDKVLHGPHAGKVWWPANET